jgi:hypothetical protein
VEDTPAADSSPQFSAGLVVGDAALILRCREGRTEAAFSTRDTYLGGENVTVRYRFDQQEPVKEVWRSSVNGRAAFAPKAEDFIRALPDNGRVFIRAIAADRNNKDANFQLVGVSEIRGKIARACNWPNVADELTTGTTNPSGLARNSHRAASSTRETVIMDFGSKKLPKASMYATTIFQRCAKRRPNRMKVVRCVGEQCVRETGAKARPHSKFRDNFQNALAHRPNPVADRRPALR